MPFDDLHGKTFCLSDIPVDAIQTMRANADMTRATCGGHNKAARNAVLVAYYDKYLTFKGVVIDEALEGAFNGPGSA